MTLPLAGVRVLDLSRLLPGGYCTMVLADLGADVIKVESPGKGDYVRWMPPFTDSGVSGMHLALNRGKRAITIDLKNEGGAEVFRDLAAGADVVVESFRPGVMDRLGVGYEVLRARNPGLIYAAISGYGATGPYVHRAGHDINYLAHAGALSFTGHPDTGPWQPGLQIGDLGGGGLMALTAILVALRVRDTTGAGQFCDVSMTDGVLSWLSVHAGAFAVTGAAPQAGRETLNGGSAFYGVYPCADGGHLAIGAFEPKFFGALTAALGVPELAAWQFDGARQEELRARLEAIFKTRSRDEWVAELADVDACVSPVLDLAEAYADPQVIAREMVQPQALPDGSSFRQLGVVPRLSETPGRVGGPAPALGADTDDVLAELGRTPEQIAVLRAAGAL